MAFNASATMASWLIATVSFSDRMPGLSERAHGHHRSAQAGSTKPADLRHLMTPADAPNASDGSLAAPKPPQNFAAQPTGNASRTRRVPAAAHASPARVSLSLVALQSLALRPAREPQLAITGAIRPP